MPDASLTILIDEVGSVATKVVAAVPAARDEAREVLPAVSEPRVAPAVPRVALWPLIVAELNVVDPVVNPGPGPLESIVGELLAVRVYPELEASDKILLCLFIKRTVCEPVIALIFVDELWVAANRVVGTAKLAVVVLVPE